MPKPMDRIDGCIFYFICLGLPAHERIFNESLAPYHDASGYNFYFRGLLHLGFDKPVWLQRDIVLVLL